MADILPTGVDSTTGKPATFKSGDTVQGGGAGASTELPVSGSDPTPEAGKVLLYSKDTLGNDSNTKLLLHMNGGEGSTLFTDSSASTHTVNPFSGAVQRVLPPKWGASVGDFITGGSRLEIADSPDWDFTGDFTIDCWINPDNIGANNVIVNHGVDLNTRWFFQIFTNNLRFELLDATVSQFALQSSGGLTNGIWQHVAVDRSGSTLNLYINGAIVDTATHAPAFPAMSSVLGVGSDIILGGSTHYDGQMDELRISDVARYAGAFTPELAPYDFLGAFAMYPDGSKQPLTAF